MNMYLLLSPAQKQIQYRLNMNMYLLLSPAQKQIQYRLNMNMYLLSLTCTKTDSV